MASPIVRACIRQVQALYETGSLLLDENRSQMESLELSSDAETPDITTQRLRAFYILEVLYTTVLPSAVRPSDVDLKDLFEGPFERTDAGLTQLTEAFKRAARLLRVEAGELELLGEKENPGMLMMVGTLKAPAGVAQRGEELTRKLRAALRSDKSLKSFGTTFIDCLRLGGYSYAQCLDYIQTLLSITPLNPIRPWNTTNRFQV